MTEDDFIYILCEFCKTHQMAEIKNSEFIEELISKMILVNKNFREYVQSNTGWAIQNGGPFEFNLRDLFRWVQAVENVSFFIFLFG